jgi:monomeric sarcosine oxidase
MRIAVVGLGGTGSAALRFLARSGHRVTGFERFRIGHDRGSSHGESRIIRYAYTDPLYTELMADAYPLWDELERESGESLFVRCGSLTFGPRSHPDLASVEQALQSCGRPYERLDAAEIAKRFPAFRVEEERIGLFQEDGGFLRASACVAANAALAARYGAVIREECAIEALETAPGGGVRIRIAGEDAMDFDAAIVTAGAWAGRLVPELHPPLRVTRQEIVYFAIARRAELFDAERLPVWIDADSLHYGFPADGRIAGVKISLHRPGEIWNPDTPHRPADESFVRARAEYAVRLFPDLSPVPTHAQVCLYTSTPDEDFVIDRAPGLPGAWIVSACSGHGFKFTVLCGSIAADLATGAGCRHDLARFSLSRFGETQTLWGTR